MMNGNEQAAEGFHPVKIGVETSYASYEQS